jgi:hypothetical protein
VRPSTNHDHHEQHDDDDEAELALLLRDVVAFFGFAGALAMRISCLRIELSGRIRTRQSAD